MNKQSRLAAARRAFQSGDIQASRIAHQPSRIINNQSFPLLPTGKIQTQKHIELHHQQENTRYFLEACLQNSILTLMVLGLAIGSIWDTHKSLIVLLVLGGVQSLGWLTSRVISDCSFDSFFKIQKERELWEVKNNPQGQQNQTIELYMERGMKQTQASRIAQILAKYTHPWVQLMMVEELQLFPLNSDYVLTACQTFCVIIVYKLCALSPLLLAGVFRHRGPEMVSWSAVSALTLYILTSIRNGTTYLQSVYRSSIKGLLIGLASVSSGILVGKLVS